MSFEPPPQHSSRRFLLFINIALHHEPFQAILDPRPKTFGAELVPEAVEGLPFYQTGPLQRS